MLHANAERGRLRELGISLTEKTNGDDSGRVAAVFQRAIYKD